MIDFTVTPDGSEPYNVKAEARDVLVWERTGKGKVFSELMERLSMIDMYKLAWLASRRTGKIDKTVTLEQFEEAYELGMLEGEEGTADPIRSAPSIDHLSHLQSRLESLQASGSTREAEPS